MKSLLILPSALVLAALAGCATTETTDAAAPLVAEAAPAAVEPTADEDAPPAVDEEEDDNGVICTRERVKGSLIPRRVCTTALDRRNQEENAEHDRQTLRRAPVWNSPSGG